MLSDDVDDDNAALHAGTSPQSAAAPVCAGQHMAKAVGNTTSGADPCGIVNSMASIGVPEAGPLTFLISHAFRTNSARLVDVAAATRTILAKSLKLESWLAACAPYEIDLDGTIPRLGLVAGTSGWLRSSSCVTARRCAI